MNIKEIFRQKVKELIYANSTGSWSTGTTEYIDEVDIEQLSFDIVNLIKTLNNMDTEEWIINE